MEAKLVCNQDLETFEYFKTKYFEVGYYAQKSPLKPGANEDSLGLIINNKQAILALGDGVGGHPNGDLASSTTVTNLINTFKKNDNLSTSLPTLRHTLINTIEACNKKLMHDHIGAKTTLSTCIINQNILQSLQIGDSSTLVCGQKGLLKYKSAEHSPVGYALAAGLLQEKEALEHPERHLVANVVGDPEMYIDIGPQINLASNDTVLIASDGIFDNFLSDELIEMIRKESLPEVLQKLTELCQPMRSEETADSFNKIDDISFILCRGIKSA